MPNGSYAPALALLAAAQERGDVAAARGLWEQVLAQAPQGSEVAGEARASLRLFGDAR